ncbi:hypothetical protein C4D60_Mb01t15740 [Musa balbisiana]|uniref:Uncharacterized protein n=1 Tax=Musa balbisiana TaxID=52838 RepID=A0A4S8JMJ4_MUSBA|nr:hypothetical protein C4D60_Mb01t15740 [Musa balbisiana]
MSAMHGLLGIKPRGFRWPNSLAAATGAGRGCTGKTSACTEGRQHFTAPADRQRRVPGDIELSMLRQRSNPRFLGMMIVVSEHGNLQPLSSGKIFLLTQESHQFCIMKNQKMH